MSDAYYFAFELLFNTVEDSVQAKSDVLMAVIHWFLIKHSFRNVGIGDHETVIATNEKSELLPEGWNSNSDSYCLRYVNNGRLYALFGTVNVKTMLVSLRQIKPLVNVSCVNFQIDDTVKALKGSITTLIAELPSVLDRFRKELLAPPVFRSGQKDGRTQTTQTETAKRVDERDERPLPMDARIIIPWAMGSGLMRVDPGDQPNNNGRPNPSGVFPVARSGAIIDNISRVFRNPDLFERIVSYIFGWY